MIFPGFRGVEYFLYANMYTSDALWINMKNKFIFFYLKILCIFVFTFWSILQIYVRWWWCSYVLRYVVQYCYTKYYHVCVLYRIHVTSLFKLYLVILLYNLKHFAYFATFKKNLQFSSSFIYPFYVILENKM